MKVFYIYTGLDRIFALTLLPPLMAIVYNFTTSKDEKLPDTEKFSYQLKVLPHINRINLIKYENKCIHRIVN